MDLYYFDGFKLAMEAVYFFVVTTFMAGMIILAQLWG